MKKSSKVFVFIPLMLSIMIIQNLSISSNLVLAGPISNDNNSSIYYLDHDPIIIDSNDDFITYGFPGNGTTDSPYIIANYSIVANSEYGIKICCVTKVFSIQNCSITLTNDSTTYAIYLQSSPRYCSILNNTFTDNDYGIFLHTCSDMYIESNIFIGNLQGIFAVNSFSLYIYYNHISGSNQNAMYFYECLWLQIKQNNIFENLQTGIRFNEVDESTIRNNTFSKNYGYALYFKSNTDWNDIYWNIFENNSIPYTSQAYDSGENVWYKPFNYTGNEWSDLGMNCVYLIDGVAETYDYFPLNKVAECTYYTPTNPDTSETHLAFGISLLVIFSIATIVRIRRKKN